MKKLNGNENKENTVVYTKILSMGSLADSVQPRKE